MEHNKNKENTKRRLIDAVAHVFRTEGYAGLGVNKISRIAGVNKKLIYRYFKSFDRLVEAYVVETDYWMKFAECMRHLPLPEGMEETQHFIASALKEQFKYFYAEPEMQQLILWEVSTDSELMRSIHRTRESMGQDLLELTDPYLSENKVNFRAVAALLVGGIYYTILHSRFNGGKFADVDLKTDSGRKAILQAIDDIVELVFERSAR